MNLTRNPTRYHIPIPISNPNTHYPLYPLTKPNYILRLILNLNLNLNLSPSLLPAANTIAPPQRAAATMAAAHHLPVPAQATRAPPRSSSWPELRRSIPSSIIPPQLVLPSRPADPPPRLHPGMHVEVRRRPPRRGEDRDVLADVLCCLHCRRDR